MKQYLDLVQHIISNGVEKTDRTGTGTLSIFGYQTRFDLSNGFPLLTTKTVSFKSILHELLWFLRGDTNISYLQKQGVHIWDEWADKNNDLGPIYGAQWRSWSTAGGETIDQISDLITNIKTDSDSRRLIVSAWNVGELKQMALMPCHLLFQFYVHNGELSCQLYQRSADIFLGLPFNMASYSLLTKMVAQVTGLRAKEFIHTLGDAHIYLNHLEQVKEQLQRRPFQLPTVEINPAIRSIFDFRFEDFELHNYKSYPAIQAPIAV